MKWKFVINVTAVVGALVRFAKYLKKRKEGD